MSPAPSAPIPLYFGGLSDAALRRAARLGDGWISDIHSTAELAAFVARLRAERAAHGRAELPFAVLAAANDAFGLDGYRRLEEAGVTHLLTMPWFVYGGASSLAEKLDSLARFADGVIAKLG